MTTIAGASQYLGAATLANARGYSPSLPTVLGSEGSTASILEAGRSSLLSVRGIGISASARSFNNEFLSSSRSTGNTLLSLAAGSANTSVEGALIAIRGIQASLPRSAISNSAIANATPDTEGKSQLGSIIDQEA